MKIWKMAAATAALAAAAGIGAAIAPAGHAQSPAVAPRVLDVFGLGGGRIGVSVSDLDQADLKNKPANGVVVDDVSDGSPAASAGLKKGDVVVEFDGERVRSVRQFTRLVSETPPGRTVAAAVQRDGQRVSVNVTPREADVTRIARDAEWRAMDELRAMRIPPRAPAAPPRPATPRPPSMESFIWRSGNQLGASVQSLSPQLREYFGTTQGVLVSSVESDSAAAKAGVKAGDVITAVNGSTVDDPSDLRRELQRSEAGQEFTLSVMREKKTLTLKGKTEAAPARRRGTTRTIL